MAPRFIWLAVMLSLISVIACGVVPQPSPATPTPKERPPQGFVAPGEAVDTWLASYGYTYAGNCAQATLDDIGKWCSTLVEDTPWRKVYLMGPVRSEYVVRLTVALGNDGLWRITQVEKAWMS